MQERPSYADQVAVGLENGEIHLFKVFSDEHIAQIANRTDRVFDLSFSQNSHYLFSGHGSGMVQQWELDGNVARLHDKLNIKEAVYGISVIDDVEQPLVAIAGRRNTFILWDWEGDRAYSINYFWRDTFNFPAVVGQNQYINSIDVADEHPILATADNRGYITLWDTDELRRCVQNPLVGPDDSTASHQKTIQHLQCSGREMTDQWQVGQVGQSVRSLALSDDGCYLATAGDDGRVMLWPLTAKGERFQSTGIRLAHHDMSLRSIDLEFDGPNRLLVVSDAPNDRINLYSRRVNPQTTCLPPTETTFIIPPD